MNVQPPATPLAQEQTRIAMRDSSDPRAARTRRSIIDAARTLVAEGNPTPSVSEIARYAGISRSSFYTQFASLNELSVEVFSDALEAIAASDAELRRAHTVSEYEATRIATARLVAHVAQNRDFYRVGLQVTVAAHHEAVTRVAAHYLEAECVRGAPAAGVGVDAAALYLAGGQVTLLHAWITGGLDVSADELTAQLMALLPAWLAPPGAS